MLKAITLLRDWFDDLFAPEDSHQSHPTTPPHFEGQHADHIPPEWQQPDLFDNVPHKGGVEVQEHQPPAWHNFYGNAPDYSAPVTWNVPDNTLYHTTSYADAGSNSPSSFNE